MKLAFRLRHLFALLPKQTAALYALGSFVFAAGMAHAVTIDIPITVDTHVDSRTSNGADGWNFGADHTDKVVVNSQDSPTSLCRALFRLPDDLWLYTPAQIVSAKVIFYVWQDNSGSRNVNLYPLTTNFAQGTGSKNWQPDPVDGATWWTRDGTNAWTNPGGDFDTNYPIVGVKEDILDPDAHDRFFHWDITALLNDATAREELQAYGALLRIDELPYPPSGIQYWAAFTSSHDPACQPPFPPHLELIFVPLPTALFNLTVSNGMVSFGISNLTVNATNVIECSPDLTLPDGWTAVTSFTASASTTNWISPQCTNAFYRVRSMP